MKRYIKNNLVYIISSIIMISYTHVSKLIYAHISIDTEILLMDPTLETSEYLTSSRPGLLWFKKLFGLPQYNPYVSNIVTVSLMVVTSILVGYFVTQIIGDINMGWITLIVSGLFLTNPIVTEFLSFDLQSMEIMFGMVCVLFGGYTSFRIGDSNAIKEKILFGIISLVCFIFAFSMYQAFLPITMIWIINILFIKYIVMYDENSVDGILTNKKLLERKKWYSLVKIIAVFLVAFVAYEIIVNVFYAKSDYLEGNIYWLSSSIVECIKRIIKSIIEVIIGRSMYYSVCNVLLLVMLLGGLVYYVIKRKVSLYDILIIIGELASPFLMFVILGGHPQSIHAEMDVAFGISMWGLSGYILLRKICAKELHAKRMLSVIGIVGVLLIAMTSWSQFKVTKSLYYADDTCYENDVYMTHQIGDVVRAIQISEDTDYPVYICGRYKFEPNPAGCTGDAMGVSFFGWCDGVDWHNKRSLYFMASQGYSFKELTKEEYEALENSDIADDMPVWPVEGSVALKDDVIVVKLAE